MDKTKEKKHIHLNAEEKRHVAELIAKGATCGEVNAWHVMRFNKSTIWNVDIFHPTSYIQIRKLG